MGAGIGLDHRTQLVMKKLGLYDDMAAAVNETAANQATQSPPNKSDYLHYMVEF